MKVKIWGCRGSIAISNPDSSKAGGNTTCFEVISDCFPKGVKFAIDAGTGFVPMGWHYISEIGKGLRYVIMFTHWHYDHILGLTLAPPTFIDQVPMALYGPCDNGDGPKEMIQHVFKRPYFPVDWKRISHKMDFTTLHDFDVHVVVAHPKGGFATFKLDRFNCILRDKKQVPINGKSYELNQCMVIKMVPTNHADAVCISYRFEEMPTGKSLVICTDHEDSVGISLDMRKHLREADLVIMDAQYDQRQYLESTARFGHGTPFGVVKHGIIGNVKRLLLTHHDPRRTDALLESLIIKEGKEALERLRVDPTFLSDFRVKADEIILTDQNIGLCYDYQTVEL